jgi:GTPase SAR1 family protein
VLGTIGGGGERAKQLGEARDNLLQDAFRLMVVGEFKRGKSTLINALLGKDVLPARVAPCTAILTEVRYGEKPHAVLHYNDSSKAPAEVGVDELRKYVVIEDGDDVDDDPSGRIRQSPYSRMEVYYPLPLCKNNVQIVDSPGLNEHKTRTKIALDFLSKADALVLVLSFQQFLSQSELAFIDNELKGRDLRHVFFVCNHYDVVADSPDDLEDIEKRFKKYLEPRVGTNARIFYVSARTALVAKKNGDRAALERSGLVPFETALERFLATERGRVKLLTPLRMGETAVREAVTELIPRSEAMLAQPLEKLRKAYEEQRPRLEEAERQRERLLRSVERRRDALIREATASYQRFVSDVELGIRAEVAKVDVATWDALLRRNSVKKQIAEHLQGWLQKRCKKWQDGDFARICDSHVKDLEADIEEQAREFLSNIKNVQRALAPSVKTVEGEEDVSIASRVLGAVGGFFVGGVGSAIEGAAMGGKEMLKGLALHVVVAGGLIAAGVSAAIVVPVLAALGVARTWMGAQSVADRMREEVAKELIDELRKNLPDTEAQISAQITESFGNVYRGLDASLRIYIDEVKGQLEAILKEKEEGEARVRAEQERLAAARQALVAIAKQLEAIRNEIDTVAEP